MNYCCKANFWLGLGIGSIIGVACYRYSRTQKGKEMQEKMRDAMQHAGEKAGELWQQAKSKVMDSGSKVVDKIAEKANDMAGKAEDMKEKVHNYTDPNKQN